MPSFDLTDIQLSTALLQESDSCHRTAWLVDSSDLIITAGHKLSQDRWFSVKFCDREAFLVEVLDRGFDERNMVDYAILKAPHDKIKGIPGISISWKKIKQKSREQIVIFGFRESVPDLISLVEGSLVGTPISIRDAALYNLQLGISPEMLNGFSGAAICVKGDDDIYQAVGIFTQQISRARNTCFGIPFERIKVHSKQLKFISNRPKLPSPQKLTIDQRIGTKISLPEDKNDRFAIFDLEEDNPSDLLPKFSNTLDKIGGQWEWFLDQLNQRRDSLKWLSKGKVPSLNQVNISNIGGLDLINKKLIYDNTRLVVFSALFNNKILELPDTFEKNSHVIAINLRQPNFSITGAKSFNLLLNLYKTDDYLLEKDKIFNIFEDVLLDLQVFHKLPFLRHFFGSLDHKRAFSLSKIEFIRYNNLKQYGTSPERSIASYASLASCARSSLPGKLNLDEYRKIWYKYIYNWLFTSTYNNSNPDFHVPSLTNEEIVNNILSWPRLGGQISEKKLKRALSLDNEKGLHILFIAIRRPEQSRHVADIANFFGREKWKKNMIISTTYSFLKLTIPFKFIPYLQLYFFSRR